MDLRVIAAGKAGQLVGLRRWPCLHLQPRHPFTGAASCWVSRSTLRSAGSGVRLSKGLAKAATEPSVTQEAYDELIKKAEESTFESPTGQLNGRSGRRCILEDGERMLERCIQMRPHDMRARLMLLRNIMLQNMGRERDVPGLAIHTLQTAGVSGADLTSPSYINVLQVVLLGLKALYKLEQQEGIPAFVETAVTAVPGMQPDILHLVSMFSADMEAQSPQERAALLIKRSYLSCIDLQFVNGRHHVESSALISMQDT